MRTASANAKIAAFVRVVDVKQRIGARLPDFLEWETVDVLPITVGARFTTAAPVQRRMPDCQAGAFAYFRAAIGRFSSQGW
jgi:hypothetical protein